ncbi:MAG TPA: transposase [Polyangiaceae bacterium]|nr:transposase [Polyangiaceae bacterium]
MFEAVVDRFLTKSPLTVMARLVLDRVCDPTWVEQLFAEHAEGQYQHTLLFSSVVDLTSQVVLGQRPSLHAAAQRQGLPVSVQALYGKVRRTEPAVLRALVRGAYARLAPVYDALGRTEVPLCQGFAVRIVDGNDLPASEKRLGPLRGFRGAAMPGQSLVVYDPERDLVADVLPWPDAHDHESGLLGHLMPEVEAESLWVADRAFSTRAIVLGFVARGAFVLVREAPHTPAPKVEGERRRVGRAETGVVYEQPVSIPDGKGEGGVLRLRRLELELDAPTGDGDTVLRLLTNVPASRASATALARLYGHRWRVEGLFGRLEAALASEVRSLGTPGGALLAFCVALVAYDVLALLQAAVERAHPAPSTPELSSFYLAADLRATYEGLAIAVPEAYWARYAGQSEEAFARTLLTMARKVDPRTLRKHPREPKPRKKKGYVPASEVRRQVATARVLAAGTVDDEKRPRLKGWL